MKRTAFRSSQPKVFHEMLIEKISQNSEEKSCAGVPFLLQLQAYSRSKNFIKKETTTPLFS